MHQKFTSQQVKWVFTHGPQSLCNEYSLPLYGPFISIILIRDEWFLNRLDSEIATENTTSLNVSED